VVAALATFTASSAMLLVLAGTSSPPPPVERYVAHGVAVELPASWQHAPSSLTPNLSDPREVLAVGTYPLRYRPTRCAHLPGSALEDLGPRDAFVTSQERGRDPSSSWPDFPPRPPHFGPELGGRSEASECEPGARFADHWFTFSDGGRHFHVLVAFGPGASATTRQQTWAILDSLHVDPTVLPEWPSSASLRSRCP
jgi:hypothetical protein